MVDYINRQTAYEVLTAYYHHKTDIQHAALHDALDRVPSADAVEVVRCKDCRYGHRYFDIIYDTTDSWVECRNPDGLNRDVSEDSFCSYGERKDG